MKKTALLVTLVLSCIISKAQDASVEKSIFGVQTGLLGIWGHNEVKLNNKFALRSELGIDIGYYENRIFNQSGFIGGLAITLEPRWYYNLSKRTSKGKRIDGNSGNFISLKTTYHPDVLLFSSNDNVNLISDISIVPTWGIRRNIGNHFNYEAGIGIGYIGYFDEANTIYEEPDVAINLHLRIGYRF